MPSTSTFTWLELVPRMKTEVAPPGPPVCTRLSPGIVRKRSGTVRSCSSWICSVVTTETLLPTLSSGVGLRVAVTVTSLTEASWAQARAGARAASAAPASSRLVVVIIAPPGFPRRRPGAAVREYPRTATRIIAA